MTTKTKALIVGITSSIFLVIITALNFIKDIPYGDVDFMLWLFMTVQCWSHYKDIDE